MIDLKKWLSSLWSFLVDCETSDSRARLEAENQAVLVEVPTTRPGLGER